MLVARSTYLDIGEHTCYELTRYGIIIFLRKNALLPCYFIGQYSPKLLSIKRKTAFQKQKKQTQKSYNFFFLNKKRAKYSFLA
jgi:hypothetical protein